MRSLDRSSRSATTAKFNIPNDVSCELYRATLKLIRNTTCGIIVSIPTVFFSRDSMGESQTRQLWEYISNRWVLWK